MGSKDRDTECSLRYCLMDYSTVEVIVPACRTVVEEYSPCHGESSSHSSGGAAAC
jgi:hypothetical protein